MPSNSGWVIFLLSKILLINNYLKLNFVEFLSLMDNATTVENSCYDSRKFIFDKTFRV